MFPLSDDVPTGPPAADSCHRWTTTVRPHRQELIMTNISTHPTEVTSTQTAAAPMTLGRRLIWLGPTGLVVTIALGIGEWLLVRGPENGGTVAAALLALAMVVPVALARRWPIQAAAVAAIAAVLNGLLFPDLVRCGAAFPAACYIAFAVGARGRESGRGWGWTVAGLVITVGGLLAQWYWDPALNVDSSFLAFGPPLALVCWAAGIGWSVVARRINSRRTVTE